MKRNPSGTLSPLICKNFRITLIKLFNQLHHQTSISLIEFAATVEAVATCTTDCHNWQAKTGKPQLVRHNRQATSQEDAVGSIVCVVHCEFDEIWRVRWRALPLYCCLTSASITLLILSYYSPSTLLLLSWSDWTSFFRFKRSNCVVRWKCVLSVQTYSCVCLRNNRFTSTDSHRPTHTTDSHFEVRGSKPPLSLCAKELRQIRAALFVYRTEFVAVIYKFASSRNFLQAKINQIAASFGVFT